MKTCKKLLAVLLSVCMLLSAAAITASAEDGKTVEIFTGTGNVQATKFDANDPETVLQLQVKLPAPNGVAFDTLDTSKEVLIGEGLYLYAYRYIQMILKGEEHYDGLTEEQLIEEMMPIVNSAVFAIGKPVSYENDVLTLDVYSKDGKPGAKMVSFSVSFYDEPVNLFFGLMPEGTLKDSKTGVTNSDYSGFGGSVEGLAVHPVKLPGLVEKILSAVFKGEYQSLIPMIPVVVFLLPFLMLSLVSRVQKAYDIYGINIRPLANDAWKALKRYLPELLGQLF